MTRSARHRATSAARRIADSVPESALMTSYRRDGAFEADGARKWASAFADPELLDEVHWAVVADALNARVRRAA